MEEKFPENAAENFPACEVHRELVLRVVDGTASQQEIDLYENEAVSCRDCAQLLESQLGLPVGYFERGGFIMSPRFVEKLDQLIEEDRIDPFIADILRKLNERARPQWEASILAELPGNFIVDEDDQSYN